MSWVVVCVGSGHGRGVGPDEIQSFFGHSGPGPPVQVPGFRPARLDDSSASSTTGIAAEDNTEEWSSSEAKQKQREHLWLLAHGVAVVRALEAAVAGWVDLEDLVPEWRRIGRARGLQWAAKGLGRTLAFPAFGSSFF